MKKYYQPIHKYILIFIFIAGISLAFLVPPFQKPDEYVHFNKAAAISVGVFDCKNQSGNVAMVPQNYLSFEEEVHRYGLEHHDFAKFPYKIYFQNIFAPSSSFIKTPINIDTTCGWPILSYLPQAFLLRMTQALQFNPFLSFFLGRVGMFLLSFSWLVFLLKKTNHKMIILYTALLPIMLHQLGSYGYDVMHIMMGLSIFAYVLHLHEQKMFTVLDLGKLWIVIVLFQFIKPGYETFILLPLILLPWNKFSQTKYLPGIGLLVAGSIAMIWHLYSSFFNVSVVTNTMSLPYTFPALQLDYLLANPSFAWEVLANTTSRTFEEYAKQVVGKFGWLDYWLSPYIYPLYFALFGYIVGHIRLARKQILTTTQTILLGLWIVMQYCLVMLSLYLVWNATGSIFVEGVQGRYFLVLVPFIIFFGANINLHSRLRFAVIILTLLAIMSNMIMRTTQRYYDYSELFRETSLALDSTYISKPIVDLRKYQFDITEYQNNKLGGLLIGISNPGLSTTHPYQIDIRDESCNYILREQFIKLDSTDKPPYKIIFKPLKVITNKLCITISPYKELVGNPLQIMEDNMGQAAIAPLILR